LLKNVKTVTHPHALCIDRWYTLTTATRSGWLQIVFVRLSRSSFTSHVRLSTVGPSVSLYLPMARGLQKRSESFTLFLARDVIYISRLCYDVSVRLSACPSVCDGSALAHYS